MKKLVLFLLWASTCFAQNFAGTSSGDIFILPPNRSCLGIDNGGQACFVQGGFGIAKLMSPAQLDFALVSKTVATLPSAILNIGRVYRVTDATSSSDCTVGGSTNTTVCVSNGASWQAMGGGSAGAVLQNPGSAQTIVQNISSNHTTAFNVNNQSNVRWVTPSYNWSYTDSGGSLGNLTSAGTNITITLPCNGGSPCPAGIDTTNGNFALGGTGGINSGAAVVTETNGVFFPNYVGRTLYIPGAGPAGATLASTIISYQSSTQVTIAVNASNTVSGQTLNIGAYDYFVRISGTGTAEAVPVVGGTCTPGATSSCTLIISTANNHPNGYTIGSASTGLQEAINDGFTSEVPSDATNNGMPVIKEMAGTQYNIYGTVYQRGRGSSIDGTGALNGCFTRAYCLFIGNWSGHASSTGQKLSNMEFAPGLVGGTDIVGCNSNSWCTVSSFAISSKVLTITFTANHSFKTYTNGVGADVLDCLLSSPGATALYTRYVAVVQATTSNTVSLPTTGANFTSNAGTFGYCHTLNTGIEDNGDHVDMNNIQFQQVSSVNGSGNFGFAITNENDQHAVVRASSNRGNGAVIEAAYPLSSFFYQRADQGYGGIFNISDTEITGANCAAVGPNGTGNGFIWRGGVCQAFPVFGVIYSGTLQPATIQDVYQESAGGVTNGLYPGATTSGQMAYLFAGGVGSTFLGTFPTGGQYPVFSCSGGSGTLTQRNYYVQALSSAIGNGPVTYIGSSTTAGGASGCSGGNVNVIWPNVLGLDATGTSVGTITWNLMVTSGAGTVPPIPNATQNVFVLFQSSSPTCDSTGMCSFTDTQSATSSHTVASATYAPAFWFFPSPFVIQRSVLFSTIGDSVRGTVSSSGEKSIAVVAQACINAGSNEQASAVIVSCATTNPGGVGQVGAANVQYPFSTAGTGVGSNAKPLFNTGPEGSTFPYGIFGCGDHSFATTIMTANFRPASGTNDCDIGKDAAGSLYARDNTAINFYINTAADNSSEKLNLTSSAFTSSIPIVLPTGGASNASIRWSGDTGTGLRQGGAGNIVTQSSNTPVIKFGSTSLEVNSNVTIGWSSANNDPTQAFDTTLQRNAAGVITVGTASADQGKLRAAGYITAGTTFTSNAGCTESALTGGATAGKFTVGTASACTIVITMGNSATAPNGWACSAYDQTAAPTLAIRQTASSTTTASLNMQVASSDVITFHCIGY